METNGVAVARHGLILSQGGAAASRMLFKCLWDLFYIIFGQKNIKIGPLDENMPKKKQYFLL